MDKKSVVIVVLVALLGLVVGGAGVYVYMDKNGDVSDADKPKEDNKDKVNDDKLKEEQEKKELEKIVNSLVEKTKIGDYYSYSYFYNEDYIDYTSLSNVFKLDATMQLIPENLRSYSNYTDEDWDSDKCPDRYDTLNQYSYLDCIYYSVKKSDFEKYYHELFGSSKIIKYEHFSNTVSSDDLACKLEGDVINCYPYSVSGYIGGGEDFIKLKSYQKIDDILEITTSYLITNPDGLYPYMGEDSPLLTEDNDWFNREDELWRLYGDKAATYKLTFKNENDNWYWVSTKLIK